METEEIDKAVEEYAESLKSIAFENLSGEVIPYLLRGAFKEGLESANKHWQEKTRWIPLEERLPEHTKRVFIKNNIGNVCCGFYSKSAKMWHTDCEMHYFTHWKEIE